MTMRKRESGKGRGKALDLWQPPEGAGEPRFCVATTFTFDAAFFEVECLGRFLQMDTHPQENQDVGYLIEREEKLHAARVCVLADRRHATEKESLRWDVLPVLVPHAVQHAKLSLLCWANHVRVVIGSGNLSKPGYRQNLEVFGCLEASRHEPGSRDSVLEAIGFLERVAAQHWETMIGRDQSGACTTLWPPLAGWSANGRRWNSGAPVSCRYSAASGDPSSNSCATSGRPASHATPMSSRPSSIPAPPRPSPLWPIAWPSAGSANVTSTFSRKTCPTAGFASRRRVRWLKRRAASVKPSFTSCPPSRTAKCGPCTRRCWRCKTETGN